MARDHLIPHFEPRAFENFAALEPSLPRLLLLPSSIQVGLAGQRQILVELGAGQRRKGEGEGERERQAYQKFVKFPLKLETLPQPQRSPLTCGQTSFTTIVVRRGHDGTFSKLHRDLSNIRWLYRDEIYSLQNLLIRTQAGSGRTVKKEQEEISPNHVQRINLIYIQSPKIWLACGLVKFVPAVV